ncbi:acyl carrier protein [Paenibacillus sp. HJL G12]|uniref:Acyl carrier protein n=1 Tax=Paenibacillus dendrobii TaxID=2691084 RepID=A0A7X3IMC5_9BACL|nr:acyl carrier protein [Paenibacillus dendrobii]MWV46623.1 acyl carrier protein [Paenibacillus dendrobii]
MTKNEFLKRLEEQVIMPDEEIILTPDTVLDDLEEWDSLAAVAFLAFSDRELGVHVNPDQLKNCKFVRDIINLVSSKLTE